MATSGDITHNPAEPEIDRWLKLGWYSIPYFNNAELALTASTERPSSRTKTIGVSITIDGLWQIMSRKRALERGATSSSFGIVTIDLILLDELEIYLALRRLILHKLIEVNGCCNTDETSGFRSAVVNCFWLVSVIKERRQSFGRGQR